MDISRRKGGMELNIDTATVPCTAFRRSGLSLDKYMGPYVVQTGAPRMG